MLRTAIPLALLVCLMTVPSQADEMIPYDRDHPFPFAPPGALDRWEKRAAALRTQCLVAQGLWPMPEKTPLNAVIHGKIERDDYTIEKVFFASLPGHYVSGNLYRPKNRAGKLPGRARAARALARRAVHLADDADAKKEIDEGGEKTDRRPRARRSRRTARHARADGVHRLPLRHGRLGATARRSRIARVSPTSRRRCGSRASWACRRGTASARSISSWSADEVDDKRIAVTGSSGGATQTIAPHRR